MNLNAPPRPAIHEVLEPRSRGWPGASRLVVAILAALVFAVIPIAATVRSVGHRPTRRDHEVRRRRPIRRHRRPILRHRPSDHHATTGERGGGNTSSACPASCRKRTREMERKRATRRRNSSCRSTPQLPARAFSSASTLAARGAASRRRQVNCAQYLKFHSRRIPESRSALHATSRAATSPCRSAPRSIGDQD
jgi:hypothetical protein